MTKVIEVKSYGPESLRLLNGIENKGSPRIGQAKTPVNRGSNEGGKTKRSLQIISLNSVTSPSLGDR
jgi:hypothetical protein